MEGIIVLKEESWALTVSLDVNDLDTSSAMRRMIGRTSSSEYVL